MEKSKIQLIKEWIEICPSLNGGKINVDYLKDKPQSYSIDQAPVNPVVKTYVDGGKVKQIALGEDYDMEKKAKVAKLKAEIRNKCLWHNEILIKCNIKF